MMETSSHNTQPAFDLDKVQVWALSLIVAAQKTPFYCFRLEAGDGNMAIAVADCPELCERLKHVIAEYEEQDE